MLVLCLDEILILIRKILLLVQSTAIRKTLFFLILFSSIGVVSICRSLSRLLHDGRDSMSSSLVLF